MTTTVTVETHDWPVAVDTHDDHNFATPERRGYGHRNETEFVPANSKKQFYITDTRSITFRELRFRRGQEPRRRSALRLQPGEHAAR